MQITVEVSEQEAMALAQLCKRIGWTEMRANAASEAEAYLIRGGIYKLQDALAAAGYAPR